MYPDSPAWLGQRLKPIGLHAGSPTFHVKLRSICGQTKPIRPAHRALVMYGMLLGFILFAWGCSPESPGADEGSSGGKDTNAQPGDVAGDTATEDAATGDSGTTDTSLDTSGGAVTVATFGCCASDLHCPAGKICASADKKSAACIAPPPKGYCTEDAHCSGDTHCSGFAYTNAGANCAKPMLLGTCKIKALDGQCCSTAGVACLKDRPCVPASKGGGKVCLAEWTAPAGGCWYDTHCSDSWTCEGEVLCGCDGSCDAKLNKPGVCKPSVASTCCKADADCKDGLCAKGQDGTSICIPKKPAAGACVIDAHCSATQFCAGGAAYGCGTGSKFTTKLGSCAGKKGNKSCCKGDNECQAGWLCKGDFNKSCENLQPGKCMSQSDCGPAETCTGGYLSGSCFGPGMEGYLKTPGTCTAPKVGSCCTEKNGCGAGLTCAWGKSAWVCLPTVTTGSCWGNGDCGEGGICVGSNAASQQCNNDVTAAKPGKCRYAGSETGACCKADKSCNAALTCQLPEDKWKGQLDSVCLPAAATGACWSANDCGADKDCLGADTRDCEQKSPWAEEAQIQGSCVDKAPSKLGQCCGKGHGCATGLLCLTGPSCMTLSNGSKFCPSLTGTCMKAPTKGQCRDEYDCALGGKGFTCVGLVRCACDQSNCTPKMGVCQSK